MHELALADAAVRIACEAAAGARVERVEVHAGRLRQIVPGAFEFAFQIVAEGTAAEGAELVLVEVAARVACRRCGAETQVDVLPLACGRCGALDVEVIAGEELLVESVELVRGTEDRGRSRPEPGFARREARCGSGASAQKEGARGGTTGSPTL